MRQNVDFLTEINNPVRKIIVKVELYNNSSTLVKSFLPEDKLISVKIEKSGEGKFFGYGVCQKVNIKLIDTNKELNITTDNYFKVYYGYYLGDNKSTVFPQSYFPHFFVTEVNRDEVTNELSITAYDKLYEASAHTLAEMSKSTNFNVYKIAWGCCNVLGLQTPLLMEGSITEDTAFTRNYVFSTQTSATTYNLVNWDGTETIREVLDDIAEATQTIYFIENETLYFTRLSSKSASVYEISKERYFDLDVNSNRRIAAITSTNELGDAVTASTGLTGTTVYIKNNILWDLQEDIGELVDAALARVENFTMSQFKCKWRGNPLLTIGDRITFINKEGNAIDAYYVNSTINYNGGLEEQTEWKYSESDLETAENPTTLGDALKQTSAKVDKVNKEIELLVSNVDSLSNFVMSEEGITATVMEKIEGDYAKKEELPDTSDLEDRISKTEAKLSSEGFKISIGDYIAEEGMIQEVVTVTGFTFNKDGLTVEKENSEIKTYITEDGMTVSRNNTPMLTANNKGVDAVNLKASTFLIVGYNSRFEDYKNKQRTGCFWIGG